MKALITVLLLVIVNLSVHGSHLFGGDLRLEEVNGNIYRIALGIYFDNINGDFGAIDGEVSVAIYALSDDKLIGLYTLPLIKDKFLPPINPGCTDGNIVSVNLIQYEALVTLPDSLFREDDSYYMVWQRCCRGYSLTNIISEDPNLGGDASGLTLYCEFPSPTTLVNSSPKIITPEVSFACVREQYELDMRAFDADGDSLVYSMTVPYSTQTLEARPVIPQPRPYPEVNWAPGFGASNFINGMPDLSISQEGVISAIPTTTGFYTYAMKVEEFRNGQKIGEVRRDFSVIIVDCLPSETNEVSVTVSQIGDERELENGEELFFEPTENVCFQVQVNDLLSISRNLNLKVISNQIDFENEGINISRVDGRAIFDVCFEACLFQNNTELEVKFIGFDSSCPRPNTDSLMVKLVKQVAQNNRATFSNNIDQPLISITQTFSPLDLDTMFSEVIVISDADLDDIEVEIVTNTTGDDISVPLSFKTISRQEGRLVGQMALPTPCRSIDESAVFQVNAFLLAKDLGACGVDNSAVLPLTFIVDADVLVPKLKDLDEPITLPFGEETMVLDLASLFISKESDTFRFDSLASNVVGLNAFITNDTLFINPPAPGLLDLTFRATKNECMQSVVDITLNFESITSVSPYMDNEYISLYPNPSNGIITVELENESVSTNGRIQVFDMYGRLNYLQTLTKTEAHLSTFTIDLSHLPCGVYNLILDSQTHKILQKIIIQ